MNSFGKVQIINSLVASLVVHKFLCLPSPPSSFFDDYKKMVTTFIWNSMTSKISYDKIIRDYKERGLKLIDLQSKDQ